MPTRTLLCVEDNPANLMLIEQLVACRPDLRLLSAHDGQHGVEIARSVLPDVILMDINLPGVNGIQALKILAREPATAGIPVIARSANALPRDIEKGLEGASSTTSPSRSRSMRSWRRWTRPCRCAPLPTFSHQKAPDGHRA